MKYKEGDSVRFRTMDCVIAYDAGSEQSWGRYILVQKNDLSFYYPEVGTGGVEEIYQGLAWGPDEVTGVVSTEIGTGKTNTDALIQKYGANTSYIWHYVQKMREDTAYDGWIVPSKDELSTFVKWKEEIGNFTINTDGARFYWSSSENNSFSAWRMSMLQGGWGADGKTALDRRVRLCALASEADIDSRLGETVIMDGIECVIFYDAGSEQSWGRYMAIDKNHDHSFYTRVDRTDHYNAWLPVANPYSYGYEYGADRINHGTSTALGTGYSNTQTMIQADPPYTNGNWRTMWREVTAFRGWYTERWFLPSLEELTEAFRYRKLLSNISYNTSNVYATSSENGASNTYYLRVTETSVESSYRAKSSNENRDRLCRAISEKEINPLIIDLQCPTSDSRIYYTLDGSEPTEASELYTGPIELSGGSLRARAFKIRVLPSDIYSFSKILPGIQASVTFLTDEIVNGQHNYTFRCAVLNAASFPAETMFRIRAFSTSEEFIEVMDSSLSTNPLYIERTGSAITATWKSLAEPSTYGIINIDADCLGYEMQSWNKQFPAVTKITSPRISFYPTNNTIRLTGYSGSTVYYRYSPADAWTQYTGTIQMTGDVTIYAYANRTGYLLSDVVQDSFQYVPVPTISYSNNRVTISLTSHWDSTIYYGINSTTNLNTYNGPFDITYSATIYACCQRGGNRGSFVSQYCVYVAPKLKTPTLSLSRNGTTVNGTIGNLETGATYRYRVGSAPTSSSSGTAISGSSFSFTNRNAVTVYVRGFKTGYTMSDAVSASVSEYVQPTCATPVISQSGNTVTITCSTPGATIYYRKSTTSVYSRGSSPIRITLTSTTTYYAYATASGYKQSSTTSRTCTYYVPKLPIPQPFNDSNDLLRSPASNGFAASGFPENPDSTDTFTFQLRLLPSSLVSGATYHVTIEGRTGTATYTSSSGASWTISVPNVTCQIDGAYSVSIYATKSGYSNSDTATWTSYRTAGITPGVGWASGSTDFSGTFHVQNCPTGATNPEAWVTYKYGFGYDLKETASEVSGTTMSTSQLQIDNVGTILYQVHYKADYFHETTYRLSEHTTEGTLPTPSTIVFLDSSGYLCFLLVEGYLYANFANGLKDGEFFADVHPVRLKFTCGGSSFESSNIYDIIRAPSTSFGKSGNITVTMISGDGEFKNSAAYTITSSVVNEAESFGYKELPSDSFFSWMFCAGTVQGAFYVPEGSENYIARVTLIPVSKPAYLTPGSNSSDPYAGTTIGIRIEGATASTTVSEITQMLSDHLFFAIMFDGHYYPKIEPLLVLDESNYSSST